MLAYWGMGDNLGWGAWTNSNDSLYDSWRMQPSRQRAQYNLNVLALRLVWLGWRALLVL